MGDKSPKNKEKRKKKQDSKKKPIIPNSPVKSLDQKKQKSKIGNDVDIMTLASSVRDEGEFQPD